MSAHTLLFGSDHTAIADDLTCRITGARDRDVDVTRVNMASDETGIEAVLAATSELSLFASERLIVAEGAEALCAKDINAATRRQIAAIPAEVSLVFVARDSKQSRCPKALKDAVAEAGGSSISFTPLSPREAPNAVVQMAADLAGMRISHDDARSLAEGCRNSRSRIRRRIEQLSALADTGTHTIDAHAVALVTGDGEHKMWGAIDALATGNAAALVAEYQEIVARGADGGVLTVAIREVEALAATASYAAQGLTAAQIAEHTGKQQFAVEKRLRAVRRLGQQQIAGALRLLADGEQQARGGSGLHPQTATTIALVSAAAALGAHP